MAVISLIALINLAISLATGQPTTAKKWLYQDNAISQLENQLSEMKARITDIQTRYTGMETQLALISKQLENIVGRLDNQTSHAESAHGTSSQTSENLETRLRTFITATASETREFIREQTQICDITSHVRLAGGNATSGRVEVYVDGVWGTVCHDSFDDVDAGVVCRALGLGFRGGRTTGNRQFPPGSGHIWLDEVGCRGSEQSILACQHAGYGNHDCTHSDDVGVTCT